MYRRTKRNLLLLYWYHATYRLPLRATCQLTRPDRRLISSILPTGIPTTHHRPVVVRKTVRDQHRHRPLHPHHQLRLTLKKRTNSRQHPPEQWAVGPRANMRVAVGQRPTTTIVREGSDDIFRQLPYMVGSSLKKEKKRIIHLVLTVLCAHHSPYHH